MIKTLVLATGIVTLFSAGAAFAQSNTQTGSTGAGGRVVAPTHEMSPGSSSDKMGGMESKGHGGMSMSDRHAMHHDGMGSHPGMHRGKMNSQDTSADMLNQQSYQAAQKGEAFTGKSPSTGSGGMMMSPSGSGKGGSMGSDSGGKM